MFCFYYFRRIEVDLNEILTKSSINTVENKAVFYRLYEILQEYDLSFTNMLNLDRYNDACEIILTRSIPIWKHFALDTKNKVEQKKFYSRALQLLEQLTEILSERWRLIRKITPQNDVKNKNKKFQSLIFFFVFFSKLSSIQLPIQRQFVRVQTEIISILFELLKIYAEEMFNERLRRKNTHATYLVRFYFKKNLIEFIEQFNRLYKILLEKMKKNKRKRLKMIKRISNGMKRLSNLDKTKNLIDDVYIYLELYQIN